MAGADCLSLVRSLPRVERAFPQRSEHAIACLPTLVVNADEALVQERPQPFEHARGACGGHDRLASRERSATNVVAMPTTRHGPQLYAPSAPNSTAKRCSINSWMPSETRWKRWQ